MKLWLLICVVSLTQELASSNAVYFDAYQAHYPLLVIHGLYVLGTLIDIVVFYLLGKLVEQRFLHSRVLAYVRRFERELDESIGKNGQRFAIFFLGVLNFVFIDAFAFAWLKFRFREIFFLLFLGNLVSYIGQWAFILGAPSILPNRLAALAVLMGGPLLFGLLIKYLRRH